MISKYNHHDLPPHSRVWIYQAERDLDDEEVLIIQKESDVFLANWAAHGTPLKASIIVEHNRFVVVFVDEQHAQATGCSIDKSVYFIKDLGKNLNVDFLGRDKVIFLIDGNLVEYQLNQIEEAFKKGSLTLESRFFDNLVKDKREFQSEWIKPIKGSWLERFI